LVKYDEIWRTGANAPTTFEADSDFEIYTEGGKDLKKLPKGKYAIYTKPSSGTMTFYINSNGGEFEFPTYRLEHDLHVFTVPAKNSAEFSERMYFRIIPQEKDGVAEILFHWGNRTCSFFVKVDYMNQAKKNIVKSVNEAKEAWFTLIQSARFYLENDQDLNLAAEWADRSVRMNPDHFYNRWILAQILYKQGKKSEAKRVLDEAIRAGEQNKDTKRLFESMKPELEKARREW
jgi:tetratricopeptide (TPR) repeat protein